MEIVYPGTYKRYNIKDLAVVVHQLPDETGALQDIKCVEFIVIGQHHSWKQWALYADFVKANPHVAI